MSPWWWLAPAGGLVWVAFDEGFGRVALAVVLVGAFCLGAAWLQDAMKRKRK